MAWTNDTLTSVDRLLFHSDIVKLGHFQCAVEDEHFRVTESLDNDVFVVVRNPLWFRRDRGKYRFVEPGAVVLHRAKSTIERRQACAAGDNAYWFGVRPDIFIELLQRHRLSETRMGEALITKPQLRYRFASLIRDIESDGADRLQVEEESLRLLTQVCRARGGSIGRAPRNSPRHRRLADNARAFLNNRLCEEISLQDVARATATTQYHLCRVFKSQVGMTLHAYRTRQRLGRVVDQLARDDSSNLTELALGTGFSSHSHLCRIFQRHLGMPPSQFRCGGV